MIDSGFWTGAVIAWQEGKKSEVRAYGTLANGAKEAVDARSQFEIGSISKVFTTLILCDAVEKKELALSDPVAVLLGDAHKVSRTVGAITLEELATHTSGLPRMPFNFKPEHNENPYAHYGRKELFACLKNYSVDDKRRGKYAYSNLGMGLLGTVLEVVLKKSWGTLVSERITTPLGMIATGPTAIGKNVATGHSGRLPTPAWDFQSLAAAGDLVSNAADMMKFACMCLGQTDSKLKPLVDLAARKRADVAPGTTVGLAWLALDNGKRRIVWHNGGTGGFLSFFGFEPARNRAVFMVVNCNGPAVTNLGLNAFDASVPTGLDHLPVVRKLKDKELLSCVGRYEMTGGLIFDVKKVRDFLTVTIPGQSSYTLYASALNEFFLTVAPARCHFVPDKNGRIESLIWSQVGVDQRARRIKDSQETVKVSAEELARFAGNYELEEGQVLTITTKDTVIEAQLTGQPALPIYPVSSNKFVYRVVNASLTFKVGDDEKIVSVTLHQDGKDIIAPRVK